jgi:hypothetical protein
MQSVTVTCFGKAVTVSAFLIVRIRVVQCDNMTIGFSAATVNTMSHDLLDSEGHGSGLPTLIVSYLPVCNKYGLLVYSSWRAVTTSYLFLKVSVMLPCVVCRKQWVEVLVGAGSDMKL